MQKTSCSSSILANTLLPDTTNLKGTVLLQNIMIGIMNTNTHHSSSWSLQKKLTITFGNDGTVH